MANSCELTTISWRLSEISRELTADSHQKLFARHVDPGAD